jgi:hypothetical protein
VPATDPDSEPFVLPTAMLKSSRFRGVFELEQATLDDVVMKGVTVRLLLDEQGLRSPERPRRRTDDARQPIAAAPARWHARAGRHDLPWQQ